MLRTLAVLFVAALSSISGAYATPAEVILIRHGEKPPVGNELDPRGWQRANALVDYFITNPALTRYGTPVAIYPMAQMKAGSSIRAIQTVTPLAQKLGITLNLNFTRDEYAKAAQDILDNPKYDGKMVLICWEHNVIPDFAAALGLVGGPTTWDSAIYDRTWVLDFVAGKPVQFSDLPQHLLPGDSAQ